MRRKRLAFALFAPTCVAVHLVAAPVGVAYAQPQVQGPPPGARALERAHAAWTRGDFDTAETLFKEALDQGGLARDATLDANVYLGSARAVIGRKEPALVAFRYAALLDPSFKVPPEAGKRATKMASLARKQTARIGPIAMHAEVPARVPSGQAFPVNVSLDAGHAAILARVGLRVSDGLTARAYSYDQPANAQIHFTVPANVTLPDANLAVRIVGVDAKDNEFVSADARVSVEPAARKAPSAQPSALDLYADAAKGRRADDAPAKSANANANANANAAVSADKGTSKGFFATPWPYVIGGALLAGGGAALYLATRPGDQVTVSQTHVQAIQ